VALLAALGAGVLDAMPPETVTAIRPRLPAWLDAHAAEDVERLSRTGELDDELRTRLAKLVGELAQESLDGSPQEPSS